MLRYVRFSWTPIPNIALLHGHRCGVLLPFYVTDVFTTVQIPPSLGTGSQLEDRVRATMSRIGLM
jgi:hypothetical protein